MLPGAHAIGLSLALLAIGALAVLLRRDVWARLIGVAVMGQAATVAFAAFDRLPSSVSLAAEAQAAAAPADGAGQVFALLSLATISAQLALGLALVVVGLRRAGVGQRAPAERGPS